MTNSAILLRILGPISSAFVIFGTIPRDMPTNNPRVTLVGIKYYMSEVFRTDDH